MKPFAIDCKESQGGPPEFVEVQITGFLDAHTVLTFEEAMAELLDRDYNKILVDLGSLTYISSAGIGALMVLLQQVRRREGDMVICQPSQKVYKILDLLGFTKIFNITEDHDSARQVLGYDK